MLRGWVVWSNVAWRAAFVPFWGRSQLVSVRGVWVLTPPTTPTTPHNPLQPHKPPPTHSATCLRATHPANCLLAMTQKNSLFPTTLTLRAGAWCFG